MNAAAELPPPMATNRVTTIFIVCTLLVREELMPPLLRAFAMVSRLPEESMSAKLPQTSLSKDKANPSVHSKAWA